MPKKNLWFDRGYTKNECKAIMRIIYEKQPPSKLKRFCKCTETFYCDICRLIKVYREKAEFVKRLAKINEKWTWGKGSKWIK